MTTLDPRRTVPATVVSDIDAEGLAPGSVEVRGTSTVVYGYGFTCPGCGARNWLALSEDQPHPRWRVTGGDAATPTGVTVEPSIFHTKERGGCGWHGYLRAGVFVSL